VGAKLSYLQTRQVVLVFVGGKKIAWFLERSSDPKIGETKKRTPKTKVIIILCEKKVS
jgi:hypothetical protein